MRRQPQVLFRSRVAHRPGLLSNQYAYMLEYRAEIALWAALGRAALESSSGSDWFGGAGGLG